MKFLPETLAQALYLATKDRSEDETRPIIARFLTHILDKYGPQAPDKVLQRLPAAIKKAEGIEDVLVESARGLTPAAVVQVLQGLGIDLNKAEVTMNIDPGLIGGVRVRRRDTVFDATIRNKLSRLGKLPAGPAVKA